MGRGRDCLSAGSLPRCVPGSLADGHKVPSTCAAPQARGAQQEAGTPANTSPVLILQLSKHQSTHVNDPSTLEDQPEV